MLCIINMKMDHFDPVYSCLEELGAFLWKIKESFIMKHLLPHKKVQTLRR